jgi:DNA-binding NarL/FixJ family response regulator
VVHQQKGADSKAVRVVLVDMSRLTRELIRRILDEQPEIEVVGEVPNGSVPLSEVLEESGAEMIIVGEEAPDLVAECRALLGGAGPRSVIAVVADGRAAHLYGVRSYETATKEFSREFVLDAIGIHRESSTRAGVQR